MHDFEFFELIICEFYYNFPILKYSSQWKAE